MLATLEFDLNEREALLAYGLSISYPSQLKLDVTGTNFMMSNSAIWVAVDPRVSAKVRHEFNELVNVGERFIHPAIKLGLITLPEEEFRHVMRSYARGCSLMSQNVLRQEVELSYHNFIVVGFLNLINSFTECNKGNAIDVSRVMVAVKTAFDRYPLSTV
ncbi:hypothetical protein GCM10023333_18670 [Ferrimonas pelagia]|uniref:Uncharacterized protein n=2 Tax=Ferrimonas pelagia TaxID=1177826 RepID=A0ABP9EUB9_9GAMM